MLDSYWKGGCKRISPEAPVPVLKVDETEDRVGGAGNVAVNIASLGGQCTIVGVVGNDDKGQILTQKLEQANVRTQMVKVDEYPTITKLRVLSRNQQLLRIDFEEAFGRIDQSLILAEVRQQIQNAKVVICSDYGKGTLCSVSRIIEIANNANVPVLIDPKGVDFEKYRGATILTPNMSEFEAVAGHVTSEEDLVQKGLKLISDYGIKSLLVTRSEHGMTYIEPGKESVTLPTEAKEVYDVTGAGDTVIATLATALASGSQIIDACAIANAAAGIVVGKLGTSTVSKEELQAAINEKENNEQIPLKLGVVSKDDLIKLVRQAQYNGETVVMTNGCFDILHLGHVSYLNEAKALGDRLIVAVNSDDSVKRLKGETRPINPLMERMGVLASLKAVDWVVDFSEDTPQQLIAEVLPNILVKGGDYTVDQIAGGKEVIANGGQVKVLSFKNGCSTSNVVKKILATK